MGQEVPKISTLAYGKKSNRNGFTLIELAVVIAIIAVLLAIAVTQMPTTAGQGVSQFVDDLQMIVKQTQLSALRSHRTHRIVFSFVEQQVYVQKARKERDAGGELVFENLQDQWQTRVAIPERISFNQLYIDGADELAGGETQRVWLYCSPSGMLQSAQIALVDTQTNVQMKLRVNPFTGAVT